MLFAIQTQPCSGPLLYGHWMSLAPGSVLPPPDTETYLSLFPLRIQ